MLKFTIYCWRTPREIPLAAAYLYIYIYILINKEHCPHNDLTQDISERVHEELESIKKLILKAQTHIFEPLDLGQFYSYPVIFPYV